MWIGEKFQSNPEIAGSPRNSFRASLRSLHGGRALNTLGGVKAYRRISNSECHEMVCGSQTARDKLGSQRERAQTSAKVPKCVLSGKGCGISKTARMLAQKQPYIQRVRNSSLVERSCAENVRG